MSLVYRYQKYIGKVFGAEFLKTLNSLSTLSGGYSNDSVEKLLSIVDTVIIGDIRQGPSEDILGIRLEILNYRTGVKVDIPISLENSRLRNHFFSIPEERMRLLLLDEDEASNIRIDEIEL